MKLTIERLREYGFRRIMVRVIRSVCVFLRVSIYRILFSDNSPSLVGARINQATIFSGKGSVLINGAVLGTWPSPFFYNDSGYIEARNESARVVIGSRTFLNNGFSIIADKEAITIGAKCLIGPRVFITDSDFHGIEIDDRRSGRYRCQSVCIGDEVFIGHDVKILKGVSVGNRSVIASGSVIVRDVPSDTVFGGNPARLIKSLRKSKDI